MLGYVKTTFTTGCPIFFPVRGDLTPKEMQKEIEAFANKHKLTIATTTFVERTHV